MITGQINVWLTPKGKEAQVKLADLFFKPREDAAVLAVSDAKVELPDGSALTVNSAWSPANNMISLHLYRGGELFAHSGNCWHLGDPYLGIQIENVGFLHLYLKKTTEKDS